MKRNRITDRVFKLDGIVVLFVTFFCMAGFSYAEIRQHPVFEPVSSEKEVQKHSADWDSVADGLNCSFGSVDRRYGRHEVPELEKALNWSSSGWRGERLNGQIVLWTGKDIEQVRLESSALVGKDGRQINAEAVKTSFVRYVLGGEKILPDVLDTAEQMDIGGRSVRPIWFTIDIPKGTKAGSYKGTITVRAKGCKAETLSVEVEVVDLVLPAAKKWAFHLDLWQNPWAVARYHHVEPFSKEHWLLLYPLTKMLAGAGQKCITTSIVPQPWGGQTYDPFGTLVKWIKKSDGKWRFDYSLFDDYVEFCFKCGITKQINCYSMIPWNNQFGYYDEASGENRTLQAVPGTKEYEDHWRPFLKDFQRHLKEKGWLEKTTIAMDERPHKIMDKLMAFMEKDAPNLKITSAVNYPPKDFRVHDLSVSIGNSEKFDMSVLDERHNRSMPTTYYVCCGPARPNTFPFSPPAESTWLGWFASAKNYDGVLRWAYCSWVEDPLYDTSYVRWPAGDCFVVYPGPRSSIRFERLREGVQDYEKIRILKKMLAGISSEHSDKLGKEIEAMLSEFTYATGSKGDTAKVVNKGKAALAEISRRAAELTEKVARRKTPIMGWSSWNNYRINIDEKIIRQQADAMVASGMKDAGYEFINIDDGYFGGRDDKGNLFSHPDKFPGGMKAVAEYIHSKGLKAGIYTDAGKDTCASKWDNDKFGFGVGLYQHEEQDLSMMLIDWGYDFIKVDWCGGEWLKMDEEQRYTEISELIRAIDSEIVFNVCRWKFPGEWVTEVADSWRVSGDISAKFGSIAHIIDLNAKLWPYAGPGHVNDMDMLQVGRGMSYEEDKAHFSMWCMMASPLLAGNDLRTMSKETIEILTNREVIALNQDPLVYQARRLRDEGDTELWARPLGAADSGQVAVALLNRSEKEATVKFSPAEIGIDDTYDFKVRDLWAHKDLSMSSKKNLSFSVPGHGVVVLRLMGKTCQTNPFK